MKTEIIEVTPIIAKRWLKDNTNNRNVNRRVVLSYADDMKRGNYALTHQGIGFFEDGSLADGQHRLMAVIEAGVTVTMLVVHGIEKTPHIDRLRARSIADCCAINGEAWINKDVVAIVSVLDVREGERASLSRTAEIAKKYEPEIRFVQSCRSQKKRGISHAGLAGACVLALLNGVEKESIDRLYRVLYSGLVERENDTMIIKFRDWIMNSSVTGAGKGFRRSVFLRTQRVIKAIETGENLSRVLEPDASIYRLPD